MKIVKIGTSIFKETLVVCISVDDESLHFEKTYLVRAEMCFNGSVSLGSCIACKGQLLLICNKCWNVELYSEFTVTFRRCD